jgi:Concanavalin A-like lectin/glucanases superfamily
MAVKLGQDLGTESGTGKSNRFLTHLIQPDTFNSTDNFNSHESVPDAFDSLTPLIRAIQEYRLMIRNFLMILVVLCISQTSPARAGLIASWSGNGNANDSTGAHDGTLVNGAGFGAGINGQQAFQFNGVNQYMSAPASTDFAFGTSSFSIGLWANFSEIKTGPITSAPNVFIGNDEGAGTLNKWVFFYDGSGHLVFHINGPESGPIFLSSPMTFTPTVGSWNYYSVTDIGGTYTFYVDGNSLGSVTNGTSIPFANAPLTIGQAENLGYFDGLMQDIQISSIPEPPSVVLAGLGGLTMLAYRWWRSRQARI